MADDLPERAMDMDLIAASLRADAGDLSTFVEALAVKLEEALPGAAQVQRARDGLFGPKRVSAIVVNAGDVRLELKVGRGGVETRCGKLSGGIVLKNEALDMDGWLAQLGATLADQARRSETTRRALERMLND